MKNILIVILLILVVALAGILGYVVMSKKSSSTNNTTVIIPKTLSEIATQLVVDYLKADLSSSDQGQRLLDYKINKIEVGNDEGTCFRFGATFAVKPASNTGWMVAGNINSDGWIENVFLGFDAIKQADGSYVLGQGFTGAASASCKK